MNSDDETVSNIGLPNDAQDHMYEEQDSFSIALYSRIHTNITDPPEEPSPVSQTAAAADTHAIWDFDSTQEVALSPTFVSRIKGEMRNVCKPYTEEVCTANSFLDHAEKELQAQYDRIISSEPLVDPTLTEDTPFSEEHLAEAMQQTKLHTVPYPMVKRCLEELVQDSIRLHKTFFEKEKDIIEMAKRYDNIKTWLAHTTEVFQDNHIQIAEEDENKFNEKIHNIISNTNWGSHFEKAKDVWQHLSLNRKVLQELHRTIGGQTGCRICFNKQVSTVLVPCGHVLCETCAGEVCNCPFCHASFCSKQSIYFM